MSEPSAPSPPPSTSETPVSEPPSSWKEAAGHVVRGLLMGGADIVPGVSGGTVALVVGIYGRLVEAVSKVDQTCLSLIKQRDFRGVARHLDFALLVPLGVGIAVGVAVLGSVMNTLLEEYMTYTLATFFGLIVASSVFVARLVPRWGVDSYAAVFVGAVFAYWLVGLPGLQNPPDALWYLFVCGAIGICAMILPGISGAFLLLILGVYADITGLIKAALHGDVTVDGLTRMAVFGCGVVVGILCFSKFLKWLLKTAPSVTLALLTGLMLGSLKKLWPFQRELTAGQDLKFKERVFENISFEELTFDSVFWTALGLVVAGAAFVFMLDYLAGRRENDQLEHLSRS